MSALSHAELKVAVRTCEGKAIHGIHRKVSTYLHVSTRIFLSHEWARIYTNALRSVVVSRKVAKYRKVSATKICPYVLLYNKVINSWNTCIWKIVIFALVLGAPIQYFCLKILCPSVYCFPLTSSDSDFQFCVSINLRAPLRLCVRDVPCRYV